MKKQQKMTTKEFIIMIIIFLILWRVPLFFLKLDLVGSIVLPIASLIIANLIVTKLKRK